MPTFPTRSASTPSSFGAVRPPNPEVEAPPLVATAELAMAGAEAELLAEATTTALFSGTDAVSDGEGLVAGALLAAGAGAGAGAAPGATL